MVDECDAVAHVHWCVGHPAPPRFIHGCRTHRRPAAALFPSAVAHGQCCWHPSAPFSLGSCRIDATPSTTHQVRATVPCDAIKGWCIARARARARACVCVCACVCCDGCQWCPFFHGRRCVLHVHGVHVVVCLFCLECCLQGDDVSTSDVLAFLHARRHGLAGVMHAGNAIEFQDQRPLVAVFMDLDFSNTGPRKKVGVSLCDALGVVWVCELLVWVIFCHTRPSTKMLTVRGASLPGRCLTSTPCLTSSRCTGETRCSKSPSVSKSATLPSPLCVSTQATSLATFTSSGCKMWNRKFGWESGAWITRSIAWYARTPTAGHGCMLRFCFSLFLSLPLFPTLSFFACSLFHLLMYVVATIAG